MAAALVLAADIPNQWNYVAGSYAATLVGIVGYAVWMIRRGRTVGRQLPPEDRRWM